MTAEADRAWRATRRPGNRRRLRSTPRSASFLISAGGCSPLARCCSRTALRGLLRPPEAGQGHGDRATLRGEGPLLTRMSCQGQTLDGRPDSCRGFLDVTRAPSALNCSE